MISEKAQKEYCEIMNINLSEREEIIFNGAYNFAMIGASEKLKAKEEECERLKSDVLEWCRNGIALLAGRPCTPTEKAIKESMNLVWSENRVNERYDEIFKEDKQKGGESE